MRKGIFGSVVVLLAGACWVLAQQASSPPSPSPYGGVTKLPPPQKLEAPVVHAQAPIILPESPILKSQPVADPVVIPVTELEIPSVPVIPPLPPIPASMTRIPSLPPVKPLPATGIKFDAVSQVPPSAPELVPPLIQLPPEPVNPLPLPTMPTLPKPTFSVDNTILPKPSYSVDNTLPPARSVYAPALPGLPPLPPVPGVATNVIGPDGAPTPANNYSVNDQIIWDDPSGSEKPAVWLSAEYLFWFPKPMRTPALAQAIVGVRSGDTGYGAEQVQELYPAGSVGKDYLDGVRGTFGFWMGDLQRFGMEATYMWFGRNNITDEFQSKPSVILGRPFINAETGEPSIFQLSSPDGVDGTIRIRTTMNLQGGDSNFLFNPILGSRRFSFLAGFKYLDFSEGLRVDQEAIDTVNGFHLTGYDSFNTHNRFLGGQVGMRWTYQGERFFANLTGKFAYGPMEQRVNISGGTSVTQTDGGGIQGNGGVLTQATNIGRYSRTQNTFIPEGIATFGYRFTPWMTGTVGYNFLFVNNLVRPGRQIDPSVSTNNFSLGSGALPGDRPQFSLRSEQFWMQGISAGLSLQY